MLCLTLARADAAPPETSPAFADFNACAKPVWPKDSLRHGETGAVTLKFLLGEDGKVLESVVTKSSGFSALDEAARAGLQKCKFIPGRYEGRPIARWMPIQYVWKIEGGPALRRDSDTAQTYRAAALAGDLDALVSLALLFNGTSSMPPDRDYMLKLLHMGAERENARAEYELANALRAGPREKTAIGVDLVEAEVVKWIRSAATHGHAGAQYEMGRLYLSGRGVARNVADGVAMYRLAAEHGNAQAQFDLGRLYDQGLGVEKHAAAAALWYRKAAEANVADAQSWLGRAYVIGRGVAPDPAQAAVWLGKAAAERLPGAEGMLASLYLEGKGVAQDRAKGIDLLRRAAQGGNIDAMADLGKLLTEGQPAATDSAEGEIWLRKASGWSKYARLRTP